MDLQLCKECTESTHKALSFICEHETKVPRPRDTHPYLFTNHNPLLEAEERIMTLRLKDAKQELSSVNLLLIAADFASEDQRKQLTGRVATLTDCISQCRQLLSPVRRLPIDVLLEIFKRVPGRTNDILGVGCGIWPLSHVCSFWRKTIVNTPMLWSCIKIHDRPSCYAAPVLFEVLQRSQSVPLDVTFTSGGNDLSKPLFQILCSQSERWRSADLCLTYTCRPFLNLVQNNLPQLQKLEFSIPDDESDDLWTGHLGCFASAPNLRIVRLGMKLGCKLAYATLELPSEPIVTFGIRFDFVLSSSPHSAIPQAVVDLTIGTSVPQQETFVPSPYPSITRLGIHSTSRFLDAFTCPKLNHLLLHHMNMDETFMTRLQQFVERSTQKDCFTALNLTEIAVHPSFDSAPRLFQMLHFITSLEVGKMRCHVNAADNDNRGSGLTKLLTPLILTTNRSSDLLPSLSTLILDCESFYGAMTEELYMLVHSVADSRINPPADYSGVKLSRFKFTDPLCSVTGEVMTQDTYHKLLQRYKEGGGEPNFLSYLRIDSLASLSR